LWPPQLVTRAARHQLQTLQPAPESARHWQPESWMQNP
jgi:hypothetical protein